MVNATTPFYDDTNELKFECERRRAK